LRMSGQEHVRKRSDHVLALRLFNVVRANHRRA
jgi:hypothetical protein